MLILHAAVIQGKVQLWGETSPVGAWRPLPRRGRAPARPSPRPLPFAASHSALLGALDLCRVNNIRRAEPGEHRCDLPTRSGIPLPSTPLLFHPPKSRAATRIEPWLVPTLAPDLEQLRSLTPGPGTRHRLGAGVFAGPGLRYWTSVLRFAASLVMNQRFLPDLTAIDGAWLAGWTPVVSGTDAAVYSGFLAAMPHCARCLTDGGAPASPRDTLDSFIRTVIDSLIRSSLSPPSPVSGKSFPRPGAEELWLDALCSGDGFYRDSDGRSADLAETVSRWSRPLALPQKSPWRLAFRLEESGGSWYVRYLLQSRDRPKQLIPIEKAWSGDNGKAELHEYLLSALGRAAALCPKIEQSLSTEPPSGYTLDTEAAYEFLTVKAPALQQLDFLVQLPSWWRRDRGGRRLGLSAVARTSHQAPGSMIELDWSVVVGNHELDIDELKALAQEKCHLVQIDNQWIELRPSDLKAALRFLNSGARRFAAKSEVIRMALAEDTTYEKLPVLRLESSGWIESMLGKLRGKRVFRPIPPPSGFHGTLREYQLTGLSWLVFLRRWGLGACLADDMGLGKTIEALALIEHEHSSGESRPVIVVCPTSVVENWKREAARFTPALRVYVHHGPTRLKGDSFALRIAKNSIHLVITSYSLLFRDFNDLTRIEWSGIFLDEAQNIKNPATRQARAAFALDADYRVALTGTPIENNVIELWSIMNFLNPGLLGSQAEFHRRFSVPIQTFRNPVAIRQLKKITGPFILRRQKSDKSVIADLPEKQETKIYCRLTREQIALYEALVRNETARIAGRDGLQRRANILAVLSRLKQICNHPAHFLGQQGPLGNRSGKLDRLVEMLEVVLAVDDKALVFTQFVSMGRLLQAHIQEVFGREALFLHGGLTRRERSAVVDRFQAPKGPPVFILSLRAGGFGLNLTGAAHVFHYDRWWNPAVENQATDRAHRIGQTRRVQVYKFICSGTLEERVDEIIESKQSITGEIITTGEKWLAELSDEALREIIALKASALEEF